MNTCLPQKTMGHGAISPLWLSGLERLFAEQYVRGSSPCKSAVEQEQRNPLLFFV